MAHQKYRGSSDHTVGENRSSPTKVPGYGKPVAYRTGGENKTPAPVKSFDPLTARDSAWGRASGAQNNPGANSYAGPSSLGVGEKADPATVAPQARTDNVLDALIRGGVKTLDNDDNWQTRKLDDQGDKGHGTSPVHPSFAKRGADSGSPGGTIPMKNGNPTSDWDARRAAMLKQAQ